MGEAVLRHTAEMRGMSILVDSCGTAGYHVGEEPDERWVILVKRSPKLTSSGGRTIKTCKEVYSSLLRPNIQLDSFFFQHGVRIDSIARRLVTSDFISFTHILAADESVLEYLKKVKPSTTKAKVFLWGSYLDDKPIPDPYYGEIVSGECHWFLLFV